MLQLQAAQNPVSTPLLNDLVPWLTETLSISVRLIAAFALGTIVGLERQWRHGTTGLTTHALVALGASAYCALPAILHVNEDIRMGGQVVTGIGFLGAGLIIRDGPNIRGLSTSATVWATGAIGVLAGYGLLFEATEATLLILLINVISPKLARMLERYIPRRPLAMKQYTLEIRTATENEAEVRARLLAQTEDSQLAIQSIAKRSNVFDQTITLEIVISAEAIDGEMVSELVRTLSMSPTILYCAYR